MTRAVRRRGPRRSTRLPGGRSPEERPLAGGSSRPGTNDDRRPHTGIASATGTPLLF